MSTEHSDFEGIRMEREDALRQLLSYCRTEAERKPHSQATAYRSKAYGDVADKLTAILDGEA